MKLEAYIFGDKLTLSPEQKQAAREFAIAELLSDPALRQRLAEIQVKVSKQMLDAIAKEYGLEHMEKEISL